MSVAEDAITSIQELTTVMNHIKEILDDNFASHDFVPVIQEQFTEDKVLEELHKLDRLYPGLERREIDVLDTLRDMCIMFIVD